MKLKLQVNGSATIVKSREWSAEQKQSIINAPNGKKRAIRIKLADVNGNDVIIQAPLRVSEVRTNDKGKQSGGSLTGRFNLKIDHFELVEIESAEDKKDSDVSIDDVVAQLLG